ncbi:major tail protein [Romboutsia timonensis]|uniref:major tail protein n=1 Tax=Romboutsia timonensis TaxID=1776391 RepID=UPI002A81A9AD|nr:major tail protein [Romboutsia timonensis]MDY3960169.1 major tail protein [Romboutsia timonensis]
MAREIGISNITLFPLTQDDDIDITYDNGSKFKLPWAVSLETTEEYAQSEYHGDNIVERSSKITSKVGLSLEVSSDTPPSLDAKITGKVNKDGFTFNALGTTQPIFAMAYSIMMDDGNERRRVIYKCNLARTGQTNETVSDSVTAQTYKYEGIASSTVNSNRFDLVMDKKEIDAMLPGPQKTAAEEAWRDFFTEVQGVKMALN